MAFDIADAIVVGRAAAATLLPDRPKGNRIEPDTSSRRRLNRF